MLIYNTTYQIDMDDARNFVIWLTECYIPEVKKNGKLKNPRLVRILTHQDPDSECFSLQWEVEDSAVLHRWHTEQVIGYCNFLFSLIRINVFKLISFKECKVINFLQPFGEVNCLNITIAEC